jgi:hypothetical protein
VAGLATAVAGLCEGFEGSSAVDIHWNARRECTRRGVHCCRGRIGGDVSGGRKTGCVGELSVLLAMERSE